MAAGAAVWLGAVSGFHLGVAVVGAAGLAAAAAISLRRDRVALLAALLAAGAWSGLTADARQQATWSASLETGPTIVTGIVAEDGSPGRPGVLDSDQHPPLAIELKGDETVVAGERVTIEGVIRRAPGRVRGDPVAGRLEVRRIERLQAPGPLLAVGNLVRSRVRSSLPGTTPEQALVTGFLIGDTSGLSERDLDALRRSGLTHFVAVSGSNVALFLAGWWVLTAPFGFGPRRRFVLGLIGLAVFVVATRWEASVLRAAAMAGLMLGGAAAGVAVDGWMALGAAITGLLLLSGDLALNIGFQLSVAAAAGILLGAGVAMDRRPRWAWSILAAAVSAQLAVLPILLWHFGTVPLLSPLANLLAAPLVSAATLTGAIAAATGWAAAVNLASQLAGAVLAIARLAADWPQLGVGAVLVFSGTGVVAMHRGLRPVVAVVASAVLAVGTVAAVVPRNATEAVFLDVGQGDAVLLRSQGLVALVDGGRDPLLLADKLRSHRVGRIDLLVVTHGDIDHVGGLDGILADHGVGRLWVPAYGDAGEVMTRLVDEAEAAGVVVEHIEARSPPRRLGAITIEPLGPSRRYLSDNDGSIVLWVSATRSLLLAGDIEGVAQGELPQLRPDVLLVPHHGAGTTDRRWLTDIVGEVAVISVGQNRYGHPAPETLAVLEAAGVEPLITQDRGDVTIGLE